MKKILLLLLLPLFFSAFLPGNSNDLTQQERKFAIDHLNQTRSDLIRAVQGLSDAQLNYKSSPDRWSVLECVQHIALTSQGLYGFMQQTAATPNDSAWQSTVTDDAFIKSIEDRSQKAQAAEPFKPVHSPDKDLSSALNTFNVGRDSLVKWIDTTHANLRNHVANLGFAKADAFQLVLLISAHTNRHRQQIEEVKADAHFPKQ